jgi:hypothetical protein
VQVTIGLSILQYLKLGIFKIFLSGFQPSAGVFRIKAAAYYFCKFKGRQQVPFLPYFSTKPPFAGTRALFRQINGFIFLPWLCKIGRGYGNRD